MIVLQSPQFATQDDTGRGDGIAPIAQWLEVANYYQETVSPLCDTPGLDPAIHDISRRLRMLFHEPERFEMSTTDFHDLACFILHRLIDRTSYTTYSDETPPRSTSESVRHAIALYLLIIHGPTYFSHARLQYTITLQLKAHLEDSLASLFLSNGSLALWLLSVGMVASEGTSDRQWFTSQARKVSITLGVYVWEEVLFHLKEILWLQNQQAEHLFQQRWDGVWSVTAT